MKISVNLVPRALFLFSLALEPGKSALGTRLKFRCLNQTRCKVAEKAKFLAGLGEKNGSAVLN